MGKFEDPRGSNVETHVPKNILAPPRGQSHCLERGFHIKNSRDRAKFVSCSSRGPEIPNSRTHSGRRDLLSLAAVAVCCLMIVLLTLHSKHLRKALERLTLETAALQPGYLAPVASVPLLGGDSVVLGISRRAAQVYFIFNTRCPYCEQTVPTWRALSQTIDSTGVRLLWVAVDSARLVDKYIARHGIVGATVIIEDRRTKDMFRWRAVPQTTVLDSTGLVVYSKAGVLTRADADSVLQAFDRTRNSEAL